MSKRVISRCDQCAHYDEPYHTCLQTGYVLSPYLRIIPETCPLPVINEDTPEAYIRIIAVDFDGVINTGKYPDVTNPNWEIIEKVKKEQESGSKIILWTSRAGEHLEKAVEACMNWGIRFDAVNDNVPEIIERFHCNPRKITATEYWDDRAVRIEYAEDNT